MNLQVMASPDGDILWVSGPLPGAVHDLTAARIWGILRELAASGLVVLGDVVPPVSLNKVAEAQRLRRCWLPAIFLAWQAATRWVAAQAVQSGGSRCSVLHLNYTVFTSCRKGGAGLKTKAPSQWAAFRLILRRVDP